MNITLVGIGAGAPGTLTREARDALARAGVVIGAERILADLPADVCAEKIALALPEKVAAAVAAHPEWSEVCVALSGDVGFYSGAKRLLELLTAHSPGLIPGISSPQYFAARLRRPWQDFRLVSAHGVGCDILAEVLNHPAVFFLTGGDTTPAGIASALRDAGLGGARVSVGENLSYPDERITSGTAAELADGRAFAPLSVVLVENGRTFARDIVSPGIADDEFIRGKTPMTKREVRVVALSLLRLKADDVVYDIGAGTGSVSVEAALLARRGRVHAVEENPDAFSLIGENREKFGTFNLLPTLGPAPEALHPLPPPDAVFIGGSRGRMRDIVQAVLRKNPRARLVVSAIALETLSAAMEALGDLSVPGIEVVQVAAAATAVRGGYHMLEARNPVFLIGGGGA